AQFPHELITYGGNGAVFQNWAQYHVAMGYLSQMTDEQTLVMYSGHPLGLFPSHPDAPRVVITNGMVIPNHSSQDDYDRMNALGVTQFGQMTAGSYMYIGPQGIVHGTTITVLNAARKYLNRDDLAGVTYVTSGLGGMSGAQAKAAVIAGATSIIAEVNPVAAFKRHEQGWLDQVTEDVDDAIDRMVSCASSGQATSIGYIGNIVDLWERLVERDVHVDLGSDQTSLHNPWQGGYYPAGIEFEDAVHLMSSDPEQFKTEVRSTLNRHVNAVNQMVANGMHFWDYGNAFMLESSRAGADILNPDGSFKYPSYVEDIMGPMCFDFGFGPFRWVCCSGNETDLKLTDEIACEVLSEMAATSPDEIRQQMLDNIQWIREAGQNQMVVGSQARILYADEQGRRRIAQAFNDAIHEGRISAPIVLGRDHHDVSGTDSPYRETANIRDGSMFTADMAVHNFVGDAFRGATWVSLHNGGGVGWGEVINGGFGLVLDGSKESSARLQQMLGWDVNNGIARRAWARNPGAEFAIRNAMERNELLHVTLPQHADDSILDQEFP
ncbi:MAG: urocanate hydratase, partial [Candidatus Thermoplasmatota archaeon]|nr:urocanate hydratase [Candidatus Thermoplasmatota archaeon]